MRGWRRGGRGGTGLAGAEKDVGGVGTEEGGVGHLEREGEGGSEGEKEKEDKRAKGAGRASRMQLHIQPRAAGRRLPGDSPRATPRPQTPRDPHREGGGGDVGGRVGWGRVIPGRVIPGFGKKWFRSCDGNSVFSRDLILKEVSELNGIVRNIVRSVCKQF